MKRFKDISPKWFGAAAAAYTGALVLVIAGLQMLLWLAISPMLADFYVDRQLPATTQHYGVPVMGGMSTPCGSIGTGPATWVVWGLMYGIPLASLPFALTAKGEHGTKRRVMFFSGHGIHSVLWKILAGILITSMIAPFWP